MKLRNLSLTIILVLAASTAQASSISFNLASSLLTGTPGGTILTFIGTVTETSGSLTYLNGDNATVVSPLVIDDTPFLTNFPLALNPFQSVTNVVFHVTIPPGTTLGTYAGQFQILGGGDPIAQDVLATQTFGIVAAVPEPAAFSLLMLGLGLSSLLTLRRKIAQSHDGSPVRLMHAFNFARDRAAIILVGDDLPD
jgi:hypothetical protein